MKSAPYSKDVGAWPLRQGHKILLFAGPKAWAAARWYRDGGAACERRAAHSLVLPPDGITSAMTFRWPVLRKPVVVVSTSANDAEFLPLFGALQRDGALSIELYACDPMIGSAQLEWELHRIHLGDPFADPPARNPARTA